MTLQSRVAVNAYAALSTIVANGFGFDNDYVLFDGHFSGSGIRTLSDSEEWSQHSVWENTAEMELFGVVRKSSLREEEPGRNMILRFLIEYWACRDYPPISEVKSMVAQMLEV